jgi:hypothetical protein
MFPTQAMVAQATSERLRRLGRLIATREDEAEAAQDLILHMHYDHLLHFELAGRKKQWLGSRDPRRCRYCLKSRPDAMSRQEAHAIPECIGNRRLVSLDECDACNERFSQSFEHHFDSFTRPLRTALAIPGKHGVPDYRSRDGRSRMTHNRQDNSFAVDEMDGHTILTDNESEHAFAMTFRSDPHIPLEVYRCLTKMAFAVLPDDELEHFELTRRWLNEPLREPVPAAIAFSYTAFLPKPLAAILITLWRRKTGAAPFPYVLATIGFSHCVFMYALPLSSRDRHLLPGRYLVPTFDLTRNPAFPTTRWDTIDLRSTTARMSAEHIITTSYDSVRELSAEES